MCSSNEDGETTTVNAIVYDVGHVAVLMPDERPIKHVVLEAPAERGMVGDITWRYYIPESYAAALANENAKLRQQLADVTESMWRVEKRCAKLRELVRVMAYCMQYERECDGCRLNDADGTITAPVGCDSLLDRMRELGVDA